MKKPFLLSVALIIVLIFTSFSQKQVNIKNLNDKIPTDPEVTIGVLDNGLKYYIKQNKKPEKRVELMLVINAGSILEDDDQDGLAHFCEHMAFNGTKSFPKLDLVNFLESTGIRFGADLNAFTSWDETVYMLTLPTDDKNLLDKGFLVLEEWAHNVLFNEKDIDEERGVILEEWRLGKGAEDRLQKKHAPIRFYNSKYAVRDIIGDTNVILRADYDAFRRFYRDWYRPNLMAVIAVGDFEKKDIEKKIKDHFGKLQNPPNPRPREKFYLGDHNDILFSIASDKELSFPNIQFISKLPQREAGTFDDYRKKLVSDLFTSMLNKRLMEIIRKPNTPLNLFAVSYEGEDVGNSRAFNLFAGTKPDKIYESFQTIVTELFRVRKFGFTPTEFERAKNEMSRNYEQMLNEKDKTESRNFAFEFYRHFINGESIPGIEFENALVKKWLPEISIDEVNKLCDVYIKRNNSVFLVSAPEKDGIKIPTETELLTAFDRIGNSEISPYVDKAPTAALFNKKLEEGKIVSKKEIKEIGVTEWKLSNGVRVVLKPTNFKNDEILFSAISPGGTSLASDEDFISAKSASSVVNKSGLANFDKNQLDKYLSDKIVNVSSNIESLSEGFRGNSSFKDLETMFQMIYLFFTDFRVDAEAVQRYIEDIKTSIENTKNSPRDLFFDSLRYALANYHFRAKPWDESMINQIQLMKIYNFYEDRYKDASDFTFFFVGSFTLDNIKPFILKYLANLPSINRNENWKDLNIRPPKGITKKSFKKGIEKQSQVFYSVYNDFHWKLEERYLLEATTEILNIKLRESLREEKGGVYGVSAYSQTEQYPKQRYSVNVYFGCNPDRVDELLGEVQNQIKDMTTKPVDQIYLTKIKEIAKRESETDLKENNYWLRNLSNFYWFKDDPKLITEKAKYINKLKADDILMAAKRYFLSPNQFQYVLYPEDSK
ncbi:MAG: insulinase family protein [Candidatus Kapabacteria bacterium]|nr:insulinase family protein [Candidatus Kapabacteria bacterium]